MVSSQPVPLAAGLPPDGQQGPPLAAPSPSLPFLPLRFRTMTPPQSPADRLAIVSAELRRLDDLLATLWHVNTRAEVGSRRIACLHLARLIASEHGLTFDWPAGPPHPQTAGLSRS